MHNIDNNERLTKQLKLDSNLIYDNITIHENGKISMPPTENFTDRIYSILASVERKKNISKKEFLLIQS